jgi:hypothetical protein
MIDSNESCNTVIVRFAATTIVTVSIRSGQLLQ